MTLQVEHQQNHTMAVVLPSLPTCELTPQSSEAPFTTAILGLVLVLVSILVLNALLADGRRRHPES